jgi:excisionase family DNA binding protein
VVSVTEEDEIMTLEEVAKYLKLQPQTVYKWAQEGQIPGAKLGKEWRFRRRILNEWVDNSIVLSKGGFNWLVESTQTGVARKGVSREEMERLVREALG